MGNTHRLRKSWRHKKAHCLCSSLPDGLHDGLHVQVALPSRSRANTHSFVSHLYMNLETHTNKSQKPRHHLSGQMFGLQCLNQNREPLMLLLMMMMTQREKKTHSTGVNITVNSYSLDAHLLTRLHHLEKNTTCLNQQIGNLHTTGVFSSFANLSSKCYLPSIHLKIALIIHISKIR